MIIVIPGEILTKRSARSGKTWSGKRVTYDPDAAIKQALAYEVLQNHQIPLKTMYGPILMDVYIFKKIPDKIGGKKLKEETKQRYLQERWAWQIKIDRDNILKIYQDILQFDILKKKIFHDDSHICDGRTLKLWTKGESKVIIELEMLNHDIRIPQRIIDRIGKI